MKVVKHIGPWKGAKPRVLPCTGIVIHAMSREIEGKFAPDWLSEFGLSVHAFIDTDGTIIEAVNSSDTAWHAGKSSWDGKTNLNSHFLGVELLVPNTKNYGEFEGAIQRPDIYSEAQYQALAEWCRQMQEKHPEIKTIVGHYQVSGDDVRGIGNGKIDPGDGFDWDLFAAMLRLPDGWDDCPNT